VIIVHAAAATVSSVRLAPDRMSQSVPGADLPRIFPLTAAIYPRCDALAAAWQPQAAAQGGK
jgi:hypothetical protein